MVDYTKMPPSHAPAQPERLALTLLHEVRHAVFVEQVPQKALLRLQSNSLRRSLARQQHALLWHMYYDVMGFAHLKLKQWPQAAQAFIQGHNTYMAGYAYWLAGQYNQCRPQWLTLLSLKRNHWCQLLFGLVSGQAVLPPTFLDVRNHLEVDIAYLIAAQQEDVLQRLLSRVPWLAQSNPEAYKYAGRALMHAHRCLEAQPYLLKAQALFPHDAEIYYHLGQWAAE
jgi:tetratricopeptide (TPR) repeat protein